MDKRPILLAIFCAIMTMATTFVIFDVIRIHKMHKAENETNWPWDNDWGVSNFNPERPSTPPVMQRPPQSQPPHTASPTVASSYSQALEYSRQSGKPIIIGFSADWCKWCQKMKKEVLSQPNIKQAMAAKFIFLEVNTDREQALAKKFSVQSLPCFAIVDSQEHPVKTQSGFMDANQFLSWISG